MTGHAAIQLARWAGAEVLATVSSPRKAELARAAGAQHVIDYTTENVVERVTLTTNLRIQGVLLYTIGEEAFADARADITAALEDGVLPIGEEHGLPLTWFALEQTAAAHDAVENATVGKVLIRVADL